MHAVSVQIVYATPTRGGANARKTRACLPRAMMMNAYGVFYARRPKEKFGQTARRPFRTDAASRANGDTMSRYPVVVSPEGCGASVEDDGAVAAASGSDCSSASCISSATSRRLVIQMTAPIEALMIVITR